MQLVADEFGHGRRRAAVGAHLGHALHRAGDATQHLAGRPHRAAGHDLVHGQALGAADAHGAGHRFQRQHVAGTTTGRGCLDAQALALAHGEAVHAAVLAEHLAGLVVHQHAGLLAEPVGEELAGVAVRDEADVVAVRLLGHGQAALGRLRPDLGLGGVTEREQRVPQLLAGQRGQHVGLVLASVGAAPQLRASVHNGQPGVVAGADRVEAQGERLVQQRLELDPLVAAQARVGGAAGRVLGDEVLDHVLGEPLGEVPHVERDAEQVRGPAGVVGVLDGAAAPGAGAQRARLGRQGQVHADHVVAGIDRTGGGHRRVHSTAHRGQHTHRDHASTGC